MCLLIIKIIIKNGANRQSLCLSVIYLSMDKMITSIIKDASVFFSQHFFIADNDKRTHNFVFLYFIFSNSKFMLIFVSSFKV